MPVECHELVVADPIHDHPPRTAGEVEPATRIDEGVVLGQVQVERDVGGVVGHQPLFLVAATSRGDQDHRVENQSAYISDTYHERKEIHLIGQGRWRIQKYVSELDSDRVYGV